MLAIDRLRWLLVTSVVYAFPFAMFTTELAVLALDKLAWTPAYIGLLLLFIGVIDIVMQTFLSGRLILRFGETRLISAGLLCEAVSYALIGTVAIVLESAFMLSGIFFFAFGSGLLEPPLNGLISAAAGPSEQGIVQGGQQALRALTEIGGPLLAGVLYTQLGGETPYWLGALLLLLGNITIRLAAPHIALSSATAEPSPANG
jgi:MFS transporter, DHA1 family, tetracycline resistance protein